MWPVSYTHLDVYKRQEIGVGIEGCRKTKAETIRRNLELTQVT